MAAEQSIANHAKNVELQGPQDVRAPGSDGGARQTPITDESEDAAPGEKTEELSATTADHEPGIVATEDYSILTTGQKRAIIVTASFAAWFSPMSGSIYYPALTVIAHDLHVTSAKVNITVTTYLILQGLAPMMIAGFSDKAGRRPAYMVCFTIYIIANLALALQNSYIALLLLRMLQSAGSSGTVALAQGIVGDCVTSAERGQRIAQPVLRLALIFWFLLILSIIFFIPIALFLPETCRNLVGDGSYPPPWTSANITDTIRHRNRVNKGIPINEAKAAELRKNHNMSIPNPLGTLVVLADFESALILLATGLGIACFYAISAGASNAFGKLYGFDELYVSLMFLPLGAGSIISMFTTGKLVDWHAQTKTTTKIYANSAHAKRLNFPMVKNRQTDLSDFPIEQARIQIALPLFVLAAVSQIGYGWMMDHKISLAGPVIMLLLFGYCLIGAIQTLNILIIDIYPGQPATATAANNVTRCLIGAAATAAILPMSEALGNGLAYTILSLLFLVSCAGPIASMKYGIQWRKAKKAKAESKQKAKEAKTSR
ncbi:hypothetical protein LTR10_007553 [Elasticomyces elasticus]|nr:hypothetical protein LTR10_007553 [Elasticomyces elasticus]KAK4979361.1 hypothetical protein LTR42_001864 [Elasticomyces elasticus]